MNFGNLFVTIFFLFLTAWIFLFHVVSRFLNRKNNKKKRTLLVIDDNTASPAPEEILTPPPQIDTPEQFKDKLFDRVYILDLSAGKNVPIEGNNAEADWIKLRDVITNSTINSGEIYNTGIFVNWDSVSKIFEVKQAFSLCGIWISSYDDSTFNFVFGAGTTQFGSGIPTPPFTEKIEADFSSNTTLFNLSNVNFDSQYAYLFFGTSS